MLWNFSLVFPRVVNFCWGWKILAWISKNYQFVMELTNFSLDFQELSIFVDVEKFWFSISKNCQLLFALRIFGLAILTIHSVLKISYIYKANARIFEIKLITTLQNYPATRGHTLIRVIFVLRKISKNHTIISVFVNNKRIA